MNERCEDKRLEMVMRNNGKLLVGSGPHDLIPLSSISRPLIPSTPHHQPTDVILLMMMQSVAMTQPSTPWPATWPAPWQTPWLTPWPLRPNPCLTQYPSPWPTLWGTQGPASRPHGRLPDWLHRQHPDQDPDFDHDQKWKIVTSGQFYHIDLVNYPISFFSFKLLCNLYEPKMAFLSLAFPMESFHTTYQANEYSWTHWMRFILSSTHKGGAACNIHCPLSRLTLSVHFTQQVRMNQWEESSHLNGWGQPNRI